MVKATIKCSECGKDMTLIEIYLRGLHERGIYHCSCGNRKTKKLKKVVFRKWEKKR